jgi:prevent-host-death family protein
MQINILESKSRLSELVKRAKEGEEVIIANRGVPVVRLEPIADGVASRRDIVGWLSKNPLPAHARRTHEEIEATVAGEREAWD